MGRAKAAQSGRLAYYTYRGGYLALKLLPRPGALSLGAACARLAARFMRGPRQTVEENLRHVVGDRDSAALASLVSASFASYGRYWADVATLGPRAARHLDRRFEVTGRACIDEALEKGGVIFALPHLGSWEVGGIWAAHEGFPFVTVAEDAADERLTKWFIGRRERLGMRVLRLAPDTPLRLVAELRKGGAVALVADRDVVGDGIEMEFFGAPTRIPAGPAVLALRANATIIPCTVYQDGANYQGIFGPLIFPDRQGTLREDVARITSELVAVFEGFIAANPAQWHAFQPLWVDEQSSAGDRS